MKRAPMSCSKGLLLALLLGAVAMAQAATAEPDPAEGAQLARADLLPPEELECLALNVYFEAGGEPRVGKLAVAWVTLNRWADERFPDTLCGVVKQGGEARWRCQFHWWCDGLPDDPQNPDRWDAAERAAREAVNGQRPDPTGGALFFHNGGVQPAWSHVKTATAQIGHHTFYR